MDLAPYQQASSMALDVHSCCVHDVSTHGVKHSHLATPEEDLHSINPSASSNGNDVAI